ncbi:MAG: phosphatase PAP2 family protein [Bacteroidales bacterium]|nr:phosphatase PAP2 family protein [Bacteroidales bacterium]
MKRILLTLLVLAASFQGAVAQRADTSVFRPRELIVPGVLTAGAMGVHFLAHDSWDRSIQQWVQEQRNGRAVAPFDDYLQYAPFVLDLGLAPLGAKARHGFVDRSLEMALAAGTAAALSGSCKLLFHTLRPNEVNYLSFPSGHTVTAFLGAELIRLEYGWGWGAGAYAAALTVGGMRVWRNWHWFSDILFGAGIGIGSAHVGTWLLKPVKKLTGLDDSRVRIAFAPSCDPLTGTLCSGLVLEF